MMKKLLLFFACFLAVSPLFAQSIRVNDAVDPETNFTAEELIQEVLISGGGCGDVMLTNLEENPFASNPSQRSWGYFDANGTDFPFERGIILSSGEVTEAEGPNTSSGNNGDPGAGGGWSGDTDLTTILNNQYGNGPDTNNATVFEFTFVPFNNTINFDFIFASEEYENEFECSDSFRDGFAFLLRGDGIPDDSGTAFGGSNIAAIPGSDNVPVSTATIADPSIVCAGEEGVDFFPDLYVSNSGANNMDEIEFDGYTTVLTANSTVTSGEEYTIKLVIADRSDGNYNSAVFFRAGSFNLGADLGDDLTIAAGTASCEDESVTLDVSDGAQNAESITWFQDGNIIPGETDPTLVVTEDGTYTVEIQYTMDCIATDDVIVEFAPVPVANEPQDLTLCTDGVETPIFDLTQNDDDILGAQDPADVNITYHETLEDAEMGNAPIPNPDVYPPTANPQTIFVRVDDSATGMCVETESFTIQSFPVAIGQPINLFACDEAEDGMIEFDLTDNDDNVLDGQDPFDFTITYHDSQADADMGVMPLGSPYESLSNPQTIFVRIENDANTTCFETATFEISGTPPADITNPTPLEFCDSDNDGFGEFDLPSKDAEITQNNPNLTVTYHPTMSDAVNAINFLPDLYGNVMEDTQIVFARIEDSTNSCILFTELQLIVYDSPLLEDPEPLVACDTDGDGEEVFDLTQAEAETLDGLDPALYEVTYHDMLSDAEAGTPEIGNPEAYGNITNPQTIYVRVTDPSNMADCHNIVELEIEARALPAVIQPDPLEVCDDGADTGDELATFDLSSKDDEITGGMSDLSVFYYEDAADIPGSPIQPADAYVNTENPQTLEVRVEDEFGCEAFTTLTLVVNPNPSLLEGPFEYELCDPDNDGVAEFDLESQTAEILNGEPGVSLTYHETEAQAEMGTEAIDTATPYQNTEAGIDDIYVRAENDTTGCTTVRQLDLVVTPSPVVGDLGDLFECDDDADGQARFDLTVNTPNALGGQSDVAVSYHESEQEALDGEMPIAVPGNYENTTNPQTIWIRLEGDDTDCVSVDSFEITVEALPAVNDPTALRVCNDDYDDPATTIFDLTQKDAEVVGQDPVPDNLEVAYFEDQADLDGGEAIPNPESYENTGNNQTILVSVTDTATMGQCSDTTTLTLTVLPLPTPSSTNAMGELDQEQCDDADGVIDGMATFDLTEGGDEIGMGENVILSYHETVADAEAGTAPIPAPEAYTTVTRTIYVRVENGNAGNMCAVTVEFEVMVNPNPVLSAEEYTAALCEPEDATPGVTPFDAQEVTDNLMPGLLAVPIADAAVTYHPTPADAAAGTNAYPDGAPFDQAADNPLYIRVVDNTNGTMCFNSDNLAEVEVTVDTEPLLGGPVDDIVLCAADPSDQDTATFDLTVRDAQVDASGDPDTQVVYYASQQDFMDGDAIQDPAAYQNTSNPQAIVAELVNPVTGCTSGGTVSFDIEVQPLPLLPAPLQSPQGDIVCTDAEGAVQQPFEIGYDLGAQDGGEYTYDWTPDNVDADGDGSEDAIYTVTQLDGVTTYSLVVTRVNADGPDCSNGSDPATGQAYGVAFEPSSAPLGVTAEVAVPAFSDSGEYTVTVTPRGAGGQALPLGDYLYRVDDGPLQASNVFAGVAPGAHVACAVDVEGCGEVCGPFGIIDYPRFFTPNGDGFNDSWNITGIGVQPAAKVYIFDRHGKLLKQLSPAGEGWDGTFNGRVMPSDDYWFSVEYTEPQDDSRREFRANFTLKR